MNMNIIILIILYIRNIILFGIILLNEKICFIKEKNINYYTIIQIGIEIQARFYLDLVLDFDQIQRVKSFL